VDGLCDGMPGRCGRIWQASSTRRSGNAAGLTAERVTIEAVEKAVNCELDLLIGRLDPGTAVRVTSAGSAELGSATGEGRN